jgi:putative mRNA 3-end processing factor
VALVELREAGFYCAPGEFYIDPWASVDRAVVTHAHGDHARPGSRAYLTTTAGDPLLRKRVGDEPAIQALRYGEPVTLGEVTVSLHPAGHILGSAQIRMEHRGEIWVFSGDYKLAPDPTCTPFEPVRCHTFVTESTFALPIFRWPDGAATMADIHSWWRANQQSGKASVLFAYPLGKAQRILAAIDPSIGPIFCHGAVERINSIYRAQGIALPMSAETGGVPKTTDWSKALILAPTSAQRSPWMRRFGSVSTAFASGWMRIRGTRRRRSLDRGFVLSDHADWPGLLTAIAQTGAETVWVTHGYRAPLARWLEEHGRHAVDVGQLAAPPDTEVDWE